MSDREYKIVYRAETADAEGNIRQLKSAVKDLDQANAARKGVEGLAKGTDVLSDALARLDKSKASVLGIGVAWDAVGDSVKIVRQELAAINAEFLALRPHGTTLQALSRAVGSLSSSSGAAATNMGTLGAAASSLGSQRAVFEGLAKQVETAQRKAYGFTKNLEEAGRAVETLGAKKEALEGISASLG